MTDAYDTIDRPGLGLETAAAPAALTGSVEPQDDSTLECDEAEFAIYCFALCHWGAYDILSGQVHIRGLA